MQLCPVAHIVPHTPQFVGSIAVFTHSLPHSCSSGEQLHELATQLPAPQLVSHCPQCAALLVRSAQTSPHSVRPTGQAAPIGRHAPRSHTLPAEQALPQVPQLTSSSVELTQLVPHRISPAGQLVGGMVSIASTMLPSLALQAPRVHVAPVGHAIPQAPQFAASSMGSTQLLPHASWPTAQFGGASSSPQPVNNTTSVKSNRIARPRSRVSIMVGTSSTRRSRTNLTARGRSATGAGPRASRLCGCDATVRFRRVEHPFGSNGQKCSRRPEIPSTPLARALFVISPPVVLCASRWDNCARAVSPPSCGG